jgi:hypothetical protein
MFESKGSKIVEGHDVAKKSDETSEMLEETTPAETSTKGSTIGALFAGALALAGIALYAVLKRSPRPADNTGEQEQPSTTGEQDQPSRRKRPHSNDPVAERTLREILGKQPYNPFGTGTTTPRSQQGTKQPK